MDGGAFVSISASVAGDVLNVIPPMRAADIARDAGLITANERWCEVDWTTMESTKVPLVHVLGDATLSAPAMPKSGHMANQHGKAAAAAIVELFAGTPPNQAPVINNTCYSFITDKDVVHVDSVHQYDRGQEDVPRRARLGRFVAGTDRSGRRLRVGLGAKHLDGHVELGPLERLGSGPSRVDEALALRGIASG